jgi:hypothetical protein
MFEGTDKHPDVAMSIRIADAQSMIFTVVNNTHVGCVSVEDRDAMISESKNIQLL